MKKSVLSIIVATLLLTGCAEMFQGKVDMVVGSQGGGLSGMLSEKTAITELVAPAQLNVSKGDSSTYIDLNWSMVEGAVSYRIERAVDTPDADGNFPMALWMLDLDSPDEKKRTEAAKNLDEKFEELELAVYGTSYQDVTPKDFNARYYYRVSAENARDKLEPSPYSSYDYGTLFGIPQQPQASLGASTDSITLRWGGVAHAKSYEVYRSTNPDGSGSVLVSTVTADQTKYKNSVIKDDQGKEFYYTVYAVNRMGTRSSASSIAMGFTLVEGAPPQPQNVQIKNGRGTTTNSIELTWDAVTTSGSDLTYYIYRSSSVDSALVQVGKVTDTKFSDSRSLKPNLYYYYQVQASARDEYKKELKSPFSDSGKLDTEGNLNPKAAEGFIISPTEELFAEKKVGEGQITLRWLPALGSQEEQAKYKYEIFAGSSQNGPFELLTTQEAGATVNEQGYIETKVESKSFYTVVTVNPTTQVESGYSVIAAPTPFAATKPGASAAKNVGAQAMANSSGVYPVQITWTKPNDADLHGFHIYRSTSRDSGYRKVTDEPLGINATSYLDPNDTAKAGKKYWYKVLAVNALGQGSYYSEPVQGWGALTHEQYLIEFNKTVVSTQKKLSLMHKPGSTDKLGSETISGNISGTLSYSASIAGLGARIIMRYENIADFYIDGVKENGVYFALTGNSNTSASMDQSGTMDGTITCTGMYPGKVYYDKIQIKGGAAGGGTYGVEPTGFSRVEVPYNKI